MTAVQNQLNTTSPVLHRALAATTWIAGVFCALLLAVMLYHHFTATTNDPWKSPQLIALKEKLVADPKNEELKKEIRRLDFAFRQDFRRRLALDSLGGWLLLGGALALVLAAAQAAALTKKPSLPQPKPDAAERALGLRSRARWSVTTAVGLVAAGLLTLHWGIGKALPSTQQGWDKLLGKGGGAESAAVVALPTLADFQANWPRFRGWDGSGVSTKTNVLLSWDEKSGAGVAWKSAVPAPGHSSPIIWGNRVFVSGGTMAKREVFCYATATGQLLWQRAIENVPGSPAKVPEVPEDTSYAAPTMATDGQRVFAIFANGDLAAVTLEGNVAWSKAFGLLKNPYGHAASLAVWPGKLIVQLDQGDDERGGSKLYAFDSATGRVLWETSRPVSASWATPIVAEAAGKTQIITHGVPWVIAYALADGTELWRAQLLDGEVTPSPVFAGGQALVVSPSTKLMAVRPDGAGDVTKTHVAWTAEDNIPDITSPASNGELVFIATSGGIVACYDAKDGKKVWEHDFEMEVQSSPAIVGGRLFIIGTKGVAVAAEAGRQFKEIARSHLADKFLASPAFADGRMFLRGATNLFCIGPTNDKAAIQP
jgi:outer membrane protein assembly factor BamB